MLKKARNKLIFWNVVVVISLLIAVVSALYFAISTNIQAEVDKDLTQSAADILKNTHFVPLVPVPAATPNPKPTSKQGENDEKDEGGNETSEGRVETTEDVKISVANVFYFMVDAGGAVVANPRQISSPGLPDVSGLNQALKGNSYFTDLKIANNIPVRLYSVPLRVENGRIIGMLQVGQDISIHEEQLRSVLLITGLVALAGTVLALLAAFFLTSRALVPIHLSMQRQRDFVADASHELRTPLTLIQANAEVALRNKNKTIGEKAELIEDIRQETEYLTRLISDLLTLARADSNKLEYKPEPLEFTRLAKEVIRQITPLAEAKKLELQVSLPEAENELWLVGDALRLKQMLLILLDNAIKYTASGQVKLIINRGHSQQLVIQVQDSGIGIASDKQEFIFERFYRVDKARTRSEGGFGLGLSIARWIIEMHKGTVQVVSQPGQGSTFTITLPTNLPSSLSKN